MSSIILPAQLTEWPLLDKVLFYVNPLMAFNVENIPIMGYNIGLNTKNKFRIGVFAKQSACYPGFNLSDPEYLYTIMAHPTCNRH